MGSCAAHTWQERVCCSVYLVLLWLGNVAGWQSSLSYALCGRIFIKAQRSLSCFLLNLLVTVLIFETVVPNFQRDVNYF